jgi:[acyl-carrier-protein] S-malonyltransferase
MILAPDTGTFHRADSAAGAERFEPGATIGEVAGQPVTATHGGQVVEWLVQDGDLVSPGQPLLRLHPEVGM